MTELLWCSQMARRWLWHCSLSWLSATCAPLNPAYNANEYDFY